MDLAQYVAALRRWWLVILVLGLLGAALGDFRTSQTPPMYRSTASTFVSLTRGDTVAELVQGANYTQDLVQTYVQLVTTPIVLDPVIEELGLPVDARALASRIQADSPLDTVIIKISAVSTDPQRAADIANGVAVQLSETVGELSPRAENGDASVQIRVIAEASPASNPFAPNPRMGMVTGGAAGGVLGVLFALLATRLDTRVRGVDDLPRSPERVLLGSIPFDRAARSARAVLEDPSGPLAESYRRLRVNLQFLDVASPVRSIVVTSSVAGEGKSTSAVNLALVMAEKGKRVLLLDADLRRPRVAALLGIEGSVGLSTVLIGEAAVSDVVQHWGAPGLDVVPAGQLPPNPGQLLDSDRMAVVLASLEADYDVVIIDAPPLLALTDAAVLARRTAGALVVARYRTVRRHDLRDALASLDRIGVPCLGIVAVGARLKDVAPHHGYGLEPAGSRWRRKRRGAHSARQHAAAPSPAAPASRGVTFTPDGAGTPLPPMAFPPVQAPATAPVPVAHAVPFTPVQGAAPGPDDAAPVTRSATAEAPAAGPTTAGPASVGPTTAGPTTAEPATAEPATAGPAPADAAVVDDQDAALATTAPATPAVDGAATGASPELRLPEPAPETRPLAVVDRADAGHGTGPAAATDPGAPGAPTAPTEPGASTEPVVEPGPGPVPAPAGPAQDVLADRR